MKHSSWKTILLRCAIVLLPFGILFLLTKVFFNDVYLLEWLTRHWYCGLWIVAAILVISNFKLSLVISYSNIIAIAAGQWIGDAIRDHNISQITNDMCAEQQAQLHIHYGIPIWLLTLLLFVGIFLFITYLQKKKE